MSNEHSLSRSYIAALAAVAIVIIGVGLVIRDRIVGREAPQTTPASEALPVQRLSQASQLQDISEFIGERVASVAPYVVQVTDSGPSGIRWNVEGDLLTTSGDRPVVIVRPALRDSTAAAVSAVTDSVSEGWVVIVARGRNGRVLSLNGISGGRSATTCRSRPVETLVVGVPLTTEFAGAGVFDLDDRFRGLVVSCGDSALAAIPTGQIARLLADTTSAPHDTSKVDSGRATTKQARRKR